MNRKFPGRWIFFSVSLFLSNHFGFQVRASYGQSISDLEMRSLAIYVGPALCNDWSLAWPASSQWFFFRRFSLDDGSAFSWSASWKGIVWCVAMATLNPDVITSAHPISEGTGVVQTVQAFL